MTYARLTTADYTFFSDTHRTFTNREYAGPRANFNKLQSIKIIKISIFSDTGTMQKLIIRKIPDTWKSSNTLTHNKVN